LVAAEGAKPQGRAKISGVNGTHVLEQYELNACVWRKQDFGAWAVNHYSDTACGTLETAADGTLTMSLIRTAGKWTFSIEAYQPGTSPAYWVFTDESADGDCLNVAAMTNERTCGACCDPAVAGDVHLASGGTATFEAGDQT